MKYLQTCCVAIALMSIVSCERSTLAPLNLNWTLVARGTTKASIGWPAGVTDVWFIETPGTITLTFPDQTVVTMPFRDISIASRGPNVREIIINLANATPEQAYPVALKIAESLGITETGAISKWYERRHRWDGTSPTSGSTSGLWADDKIARSVGIGKSFSGNNDSVYVRVTINVDAFDYEVYRKGEIKNRRANGEDVPDDFGK